MGQLSNQAAIQRPRGFDDVIGMDIGNFIETLDSQTSNRSRGQAQDLMTSWQSAGDEFDVVSANTDESTIGAIQAMKAVGMSLDGVVNVDATQDARVAMQAGELNATVFQDGRRTGRRRSGVCLGSQ